MGKSPPQISKWGFYVTKCDKDYTSRKNCINEVFFFNRAGESQITSPATNPPAHTRDANSPPHPVYT